MRTSFLWLALYLLLNFSVRAQDISVQNVITPGKVKKHLSILSSDKMKGRKAFTPSAKKAAGYISEQFERIGLEPLNGEDDFLQRFKIYSLYPEESHLTLNGASIDPESYFISSGRTNLRWKELETLDIIRISEKEEFRNRFTAILNELKKHTVVLVDEKHRATFSRYSGYFSGPAQRLQLNDEPSVLFILTGEKRVQSGSLFFKQTVKKQEAFNVAGKITGTSKKDEYVIFSSHYDHIGILEPAAGDSIANGADDNASGTTAVIALAEYFRKTGPVERTLIFVAFTAEEIGGYGSRYFSGQYDPEKIKAMFNIEMIGKPSKFGPNTVFLTGFEKSDMGKILQEDLKNTPYRIFPDPYPEQNLFYRSDNAILARLGVPAHTISSVQIDRDSHYHTVSDEMDTLNIEHLTNMIRAIALSAQSIVSGSRTPDRVDPLSVNQP